MNMPFLILSISLSLSLTAWSQRGRCVDDAIPLLSRRAVSDAAKLFCGCGVGYIFGAIAFILTLCFLDLSVGECVRDTL